MTLRLPCEHGRYDEHTGFGNGNRICSGGRPATPEDLYEALGGEKVWLCVERRPLAKEAAVCNMPGDKDWCFFQGSQHHLPDCGWRILTHALDQEAPR